MKHIKCADVDNCGIVRLCFAVFVAIGAAIPLTAVADATAAPSSLYDLTTSDAGSVSSTSSQYNNFYSGAKAFDGSVSGDGNRWLSGEASTWNIIYKFNVPTVIDSISIALPSASQTVAQTMRAPKDWTFEGSDDNSKWDILDTQTGQSGWSGGDKRYYKFETPNTKAYQYYKFNCTANNGDKRLQIGEFEFYCTGTGNSTWTGGGETGLVNDDVNWGGAAMPGSEYEAHIDNTGDTPATIPSGLTVYKFLRLGNGDGRSAKVVQTTGTMRLPADSTFGRAGATGEYAISGGRLVVGKNLYLGAVAGGKSNGILDISGDGEVELDKLMLCASKPSAGSTACVNISGNGKLTVTGEMDIGTDGNSAATTGTVYQTGGVLTAKSMMVGFEGSNYGEYLMSGGNCSVENLYVGFENGTGNIEMTGGTCSVKELFVGYDDSGRGSVEMTGGTLSAATTLSIGRFGHGTFSASGDGTVVTAANVRVGFTHNNDKSKGYGTFIVTNGAEVATTKIFAGAGKSHVDRAKVVFDGAVLTATAASTGFLKDLPDVTLGAGGLTINTEGNAVTIANCAFAAEPGAKITVTGGGTVTFEDCTVAFTEKPERSFVFAETDGVFSGMPAFSNIGGSNVVMSGDNKKIGIVRQGLMILVR